MLHWYVHCVLWYVIMVCYNKLQVLMMRYCGMFLFMGCFMVRFYGVTNTGLRVCYCSVYYGVVL